MHHPVPSTPEVLEPAYHMWLSVRDMARLDYLMLLDGEWDGPDTGDANAGAYTDLGGVYD